MDREAFFAALRKRASGVFGTSLTQGQVEGCNAILDECMNRGADLGQAAYILATAYGETGGRMQPIRENMNYSLKRMKQVFSARRLGPNPAALVGKPEAFANQVYNGMLGNRPGTDDGWTFRGGSIGQITGRDNYAKGARLLGMSLEAFTAWSNTTVGAAQYLVRGMLGGWATGKKLSDYVSGDKRDYVGARRVWNGTFEADKYAGYARAFEAALEASGYATSRVSAPAAAAGGLFGTGGAVAMFPEYAAQIVGAALFLAVVVLVVKLIKRKTK